MNFDAVLLPPRKEKMVLAGHWTSKTITDYLYDCTAKYPDKIALTSINSEIETEEEFTYQMLDEMTDRIAIGLIKLGIGPGDVVACQLPNWWQFPVLYYACARIGAVLNPLMHILRERELSFMLAHSEAKVVIIPKVFRGFNFETMYIGLHPDLPNLEQVIVVGGSGNNSFEALLSEPKWEKDTQSISKLRDLHLNADDITQLMFTSGTTGEPKGVMHSSNTLFSNLAPYCERLGHSHDEVVLMPMPLAHQVGFIYGIMMPVFLKGQLILMDIWHPKLGAELIARHKCTTTIAATPFLMDLYGQVQSSGTDVSSLNTFICAGAPIPGHAVEQSRATMDTKIISAWGMTELGIATTILPNDPDERSCTTDGCALKGMEVRVVDSGGNPLPHSVEGRLQARGCSVFGGYLKRPQLNGIDGEGWMETGDMATLDKDGYIRICGRSKDIIIRGGENIPVVEIESLLFKHPLITTVAVVGYPDERLGERACAFVSLSEKASLSLNDIISFLMEQKIARQYLPERLEIVDNLPMTASGKVQKFKLREMIKSEV